MKKNQRPERISTLNPRGKIPFRYRFFFCISAILLAFMLILSTAAFVFRETIDLYLCGSRTNVSEEEKKLQQMTAAGLQSRLRQTEQCY